MQVSRHLLLLLFSRGVFAHSEGGESAGNAIQNVENVHDIRLQHDVKNNEIKLSFTAFDSSFHLSLQQNNLLGVKLVSADDDDNDDNGDENMEVSSGGYGTIESSSSGSWRVSLQDHMYNVYKGVMLHTSHSDDHSHADILTSHPTTTFNHSSHPTTTLNHSFKELEIQDSFARIVVHNHDPNNLMFDGIIYAPTHGMMHLKLSNDYKNSRRHFDAPAPSPYTATTNMVLIRDSNPQDLICLKQETKVNTNSTISSSKCNSNNLLSKRDIGPEVKTCGTEFSDLKTFNLKASTGFGSLAVPGMVKAALGSGNQACPLTNKKILAMGVAADCSYVTDKGGVSQALTAILSNWNSASQIYESTFNIQLGVVKVKIMQTCTPLDKNAAWNRDCSNPSYTLSDRLSDFSAWRGTQSGDGMGLWHLMTKCSTQPSVGIAWVSQLCTTTSATQSGQTVSGTGVSSIVPVEWKVVAHEIGHAFGAIHDCSSSGCGNGCRACSPNCDCQSQYLMNPLDNAISNNFSPASIIDMCAGINSLGSCLQDPGSQAFVSSGVCGNGIKEGNEQCDCGPASGSTCQQDSCCDGSTCTLKPNMQCDPLNDVCCSSTCGILPATTVCHKGDGICDNTIMCPGNNATCPTNTFVADGRRSKKPSTAQLPPQMGSNQTLVQQDPVPYQPQQPYRPEIDISYIPAYPPPTTSLPAARRSLDSGWASEDYWKRTSSVAAKGPVAALQAPNSNPNVNVRNSYTGPSNVSKNLPKPPSK